MLSKITKVINHEGHAVHEGSVTDSLELRWLGRVMNRHSLWSAMSHQRSRIPELRSITAWRALRCLGWTRIRDADAQDVERDHGRGEDAHVQDVGGRSDDGGDDEDHQDRVAQVAPHPAGSDDTHQRQKEDQDGQLENHAHADHDGQEQVGVFANCDHRLELFAVVDQEGQGRGIDHLVGEQTARQEQQDGREHEREIRSAFRCDRGREK